MSRTRVLSALLFLVLGQAFVCLAQSFGQSAWVSAALISFGLGVWLVWRSAGPSEGLNPSWPRQGWMWFAVLAIFFLVRLYRFKYYLSFPYGDESMEGWDSLEISRNHGYLPVFLPWGGRVPLYHYLAAFYERITSPDFAILRFTSMKFGFLFFVTCLFLAKQLFGWPVALGTAFFMACGWWPALFSTIAIYSVCCPLFVTISLYFLAKAFTKHHWSQFVLLGISLGLGFYSYTAFWAIFIFIVLYFFWAQYLDKRFWPDHFIKLSFSILLSLVLISPLIFYAIREPHFFFLRLNDSSLSSAKNIPLYLAGNLFRLAASFFSDWITLSFLDQVTSIFFLMGIVLCLKNIKKLSYATLLLGLVVFCLPGLLSTNSTSIFRLDGMMPLVFITAGLGFTWFFSKVKFPALMILLAVLVVLSNLGYLDMAVTDPASTGFLDARPAQQAGEFISRLGQKGRAAYFNGFDPFDSVWENYIVSSSTSSPGASKEAARDVIFRVSFASREAVLRQKLSGIKFVRFPASNQQSTVMLAWLPAEKNGILAPRLKELNEADAFLLNFDRGKARSYYEGLLQMRLCPLLEASVLERLAQMAVSEHKTKSAMEYYGRILKMGFDFPDVQMRGYLLKAIWDSKIFPDLSEQERSR